jgi:signal transduction histidine kinase
MGRLIDDLLTYSRLGRSSLQRQRLSLQEILDELQQELQPRLEEIGGQLQIVGELPEVWGDRTLLTQLFSNLLENALLYRRKDVPLRVQVDCPERRGRVIVRVQDNGIGIPPEYHEKIFNLFQRLHSEDEIPGTGIGLASVRKAAVLHGGMVWVESTPGEGSTFWVKLPQGADQ